MRNLAGRWRWLASGDSVRDGMIWMRNDYGYLPTYMDGAESRLIGYPRPPFETLLQAC